MPRKSSVSSATKDLRKKAKPNSRTKAARSSNKDEKKLIKNIYIGASNAARWNTLKNKLKYESDVDLVHYLLDLADPVINSNEAETEENELNATTRAVASPSVVITPENHERRSSPDPLTHENEQHVEPKVSPKPEDQIKIISSDTKQQETRQPVLVLNKKHDHVIPLNQRQENRGQHKSVICNKLEIDENEEHIPIVTPVLEEPKKPETVIVTKKEEIIEKKKSQNDIQQNAEMINADSNESTPGGIASEEDTQDIDWQPEEEAPLRRSPRKPGPRRSTRNHRHHRKRRHRRSISPAGVAQQEQHVLKEDNINHKHHHEKHKGCGSRGRKKRKHKEKAILGDKIRVLEEEEEEEEEEELSCEEAPPPPPPKTPIESAPSSPLSPTPPPLEKHRKKHKRRESKKRSHDIRRAPTDGIPVTERPMSPSPTTLQPPTLELPPEPESMLEDNNGSQEPFLNGASNLSLAPPHLSPIPALPSPLDPNDNLPQRVAIRIKLCGDCGCRHVQDACPLLRPIIQVPDALSRSQWSSNPRKGSNFAQESLPIDLFALEERDSSHGLSVIVCSPIARYTQFGPLIGDRIKQMDIPDDFNMRDIWEIKSSNERYYLSTIDNDHANWLRFIRPAPTKEQRNVAALVRGNELYFVTICALEPGTELLYWHEHSSSGWARKKMEKTNCGGCNLRFAHSLYYRLHCSVFHDPSFSLTIRKYHCKVCGLAVLGKENIMRHAAEQHAGKGAYQCQFCKKFFLRLNYLEMHRTYGCAANPQRTRPLCDFCGRKFCQPQKLKVHIKRMHSDMAEVLREFQCKMCLKLLGSRAALQRHLKEVHHKDLVGACTCDRCGKMFQNKSNLKIHMLTHSGVKPFRCTEGTCNAAFTTKQCLQFHYKKVHGFTEDSMPKIERCVAYTFDAYSGGNEEGQINPSPPFTPAGTDDSAGGSPNPSLPSLDDDDEEEEELSCSPSQALPEESDPLETSSSSMQHPVSSPTPPPPPPSIIRHVSPDTSPAGVEIMCARPTTILSKASKKWMGDVVEPPPPPRMPSPVDMINKQRWSEAIPEQSMDSPVQVNKRWTDCVPESRMESPDAVEKKWALECLPGLRSPEILGSRRPELSFSRAMRPVEQDIVTEQTRGSPMGGEFSPLRRTEPSASLLVEAALDAAERDLTGKLADLKPLSHDNPPNFMQRMNGLHADMSETDYSLMSTCSKPPRMTGIPETGLDMSYKQYDNSDLVNSSADMNSEFRVMRSPEQVSFEQEQGLDMSRTSSYAAGGYTRYSHSELIPPHLHAHHRAAVAAAGLMYEMEPANVRSPPPSPPAYQADLLRHHWHHLPASSHHTLDLSTARGQQSPEQSMSPPPPSYQNYPPSPYHAPPPRAPTPPYHHYSGYY